MTKDDAIWIKEVFYPHYYNTTLNSKSMVGYYEAERILNGAEKINVRGCNCQWRHVGRLVHNLLEMNIDTINKLYEEATAPQPTKRGRKKTNTSES